jgi:hypothetical protein
MEEVYKAVEKARSQGLPKENYWIYFKRDGTAVDAYDVEHKRKGWLGFFLEDDSSLISIAGVAQKKTNRRKM